MLLGFETVLPTSISFKVGDTFKKVEIDSQFETCYKINILLSEDIRFRNNNAIQFQTKLFYKNNIPTDIEFDKLVTAMINFLQPEFGLYPSKFQDIHDDTDDTQSNNEYSHGSIKTFQYAYDAHLIYAGFLSQYNIDLQSPNNKQIHWWKFLSLLAGLNKQKFNDVMQVRQIDKPTPKERELQRQMMPPVYSKYNSYEINGFSENNF